MIKTTLPENMDHQTYAWLNYEDACLMSWLLWKPICLHKVLKIQSLEIIVHNYGTKWVMGGFVWFQSIKDGFLSGAILDAYLERNEEMLRQSSMIDDFSRWFSYELLNDDRRATDAKWWQKLTSTLFMLKV